MLLAVDVGNTQTTLGLFDESGTVERHWRMATDKTDTADELHERLYGYFQMLGLSLEIIDNVAIASVVPILSLEWQTMMREVLEEEPLMIDGSRDCGIEVKLENPHEVGADRIANAVAAKETYGSPVIVVDFGTATNIDVVDATGAFRGGAIMPGVLLSAESLFTRASKLASVALVAPQTALGNSTETAVQSGIVLGAAAQAEGLVRRIRDTLVAEYPQEPKVVGTGGFARVIREATDVFDVIDPDLTIRGIYTIWKNRELKRQKRVGQTR